MRVLLINCETFKGCARTVCERYEGSKVSNEDIIAYLENTYKVEDEDYLIYESMSEFMDAFNNEEMPYTTHFLSYLI